MKAYRKYMYVGLPVLGVLFYLFYLHRAAIDLVYSDYIRLTLSYLPDVWDPEKFFVPDLLTRIPVNFLERAVNVELFGYSVTFDRVLGVLGFGLSALILGAYSRKMRIGAGWFTAMMVFMFSLNKWEMLYNGQAGPISWPLDVSSIIITSWNGSMEAEEKKREIWPGSWSSRLW